MPDLTRREECVCASLSSGGTLLASPAGLHLQGLKLVAGSVQSSSSAAEGQADTLGLAIPKPRPIYDAAGQRQSLEQALI